MDPSAVGLGYGLPVHVCANVSSYVVEANASSVKCTNSVQSWPSAIRSGDSVRIFWRLDEEAQRGLTFIRFVWIKFTLHLELWILNFECLKSAWRVHEERLNGHSESERWGRVCVLFRMFGFQRSLNRRKLFAISIPPPSLAESSFRIGKRLRRF